MPGTQPSRRTHACRAALAAAALGFLAAGCGRQGEPPVARAAQLWREGDARAARELLETHTTAHPEDQEAWLLLTRIALLEGDAETASRCAERGTEALTDSPWPPLWAAIAAHAAGRPDQARLWLERSMSASPGFRPAHFFFGSWLLDTPGAGPAAEAELHLNQATRTRELRAVALNNLAIALSRQDRPAEARSLLEEAVRLHPGLAPARLNLAITLWLDDEDLAGAREALDPLRALSDPPYDRIVPAILVRLTPPERPLQTRVEPAPQPTPADPQLAAPPAEGAPDAVGILVRRAEQAAARGDADAAAEAWLQAGDGFRATRQWDGARQCYESAATQRPLSPEPLRRLAETLEQAGLPDQALAAYQKTAERLRDPSPALREAARLARALGQTQTAVDLLQIWAQVQSTDPTPLAQLLELYDAMPAQAEKARETRRALCGRFPEHELGKAACARLAQEAAPEAAPPTTPALALEDAIRLVQGRRIAHVQIVPQTSGPPRNDHPRALRLYRDGVAAQNGGRLPEAMRGFQQAIAADPTYAEPYAGLGAVFASLGQTEKAIEAYLLALGRDPRMTAARARLATLMADRGYFADAASHARTVLGVDPDNADMRFVLGRALARVPQAESLAAEQFRRALASAALNPAHRQEAENWLAAHAPR